MATLRDQVLPVVGSLRQLPDDFGFRPYSLTIKVRTFASVNGVGTPTTESYEIVPRPKVKRSALVGAHETEGSAGRYQEGTYGVEKITPRYITPTVGGYFPRATMGYPVTPTVTNQGTAGAATYRYKVIAFNAAIACSEVSAAGSTTTGNATLSGINFNRLTTTAVSGATVYWWYRVSGGATQGLVGTSTSPTLDDTGLAGDGTAALPPVLMPVPTDLQQVAYVLSGREGTFECNLEGDVYDRSLGYSLTLMPSYARGRAG